MEITEQNKEKVLLVAVARKGGNRNLVFEQLQELESLVDTAGAEVVEKIYQELEKPNPKTAIGKGKIQEIKEIIDEEGIKLVVFDDEITPTQVRNLETEWKIKVMDRSGLILDIFAKHARSNEAKTQVELAQSQYLLPRLTRMWTHLSKQYGGIGTKGPGETQIESDRRALKTKIARLKEKLKEINIQKEQQKKGRSDLPRFALIGYTNTGKSTLMNAITEANVLVEDKLFATLDTTVRAFNFPNGQKALLSDTVGFIRKLPAHLVASFRSTLAEASDADIIIHLVDITHPHYVDQINVVNHTLETLKLDKKPSLLVFNKIDGLENKDLIKSVDSAYPNSIFISATRGINLNNLLQKMQDKYDEQGKIIKFTLPYTDISKINEIYSIGDIKERKDTDTGIYFEVKITNDKIDLFFNRFSKIIIKDNT
ncbi:GTPase HflX [Bacteroidetes/Chlorobi group bacterium ChocPot_Mid]|jgi:GTP-binding protein HflX|nr:MAG: GTPase HflX [Bacteroidetes/Chlorobi group bacterium ChocPot_Mid]